MVFNFSLRRTAKALRLVRNQLLLAWILFFPALAGLGALGTAILLGILAGVLCLSFFVGRLILVQIFFFVHMFIVWLLILAIRRPHRIAFSISFQFSHYFYKMVTAYEYEMLFQVARDIDDRYF